jgi:predicted RND superfamily exporter protein
MIDRLYKNRFYLLALLLPAAWLVWPGLQKAVQVDNSLESWFLKDDPALLAYQDFQEKFGNDEVVILLLKDEQGLLSTSWFNVFTSMSQALESLEEVEAVIGPGALQLPGGGMLGLGTTPLLGPDAEAEQVRQKLEANPLLRDQLFNQDYKVARFLIVLKTLPNFDERRGELLEKVQGTAREFLPEGTAFFGGVGVIFAGLNTLSQQDFAFFLGLAYLVMFLVMFFLYRDFYILCYALLTVSLATCFTLGIYGLLGYRLNLMSSLIPTIIILLGILDIVHVVNERNHQYARTPEAGAASLSALREVFRPCLFTTLSTMAGFLALLVAPMAILQNFGVFAALGILLSLLFTYSLGIIFLPLSRPASGPSFLVRKWLISLLGVVLGQRKWFAGSALLLLVFCVAGIIQLETDTFTLGYFPRQHQVVRDHEEIEKSWGAYMPLELLVMPQENRRLYDPELVQATLAFEDSARGLKGVGDVFGFSSLYEAALYHRFKARTRDMMQYKSGLLQVHRQLNQYYPELARHYIHEASGTGRITISGSMSSASTLNANMDSLLHLARASFGELAQVQAAGYQPMYAGIVNYATRTQLNSLLLAFVLILVLVWIFIRRFKLALLSLVPNIFPVLLMLGVMGWAGIFLDVATASIAAIVLSFCIDDTIHFIHHYQQCPQEGREPAAARGSTMKRVGPAILFTSLILLMGYMLMAFAALKTVMLFGLLISIAIAGALYSHLLIFPILLELFDKKEVPAGKARVLVLSQSKNDG